MTVTLEKESGGKIHYYSLYDHQNMLFGGYELTVSWGVNLNRCRKRVYHFSTRRELSEKIRSLVGKRVNDGYSLLYSFSRERKDDILSSLMENLSS